MIYYYNCKIIVAKHSKTSLNNSFEKQPASREQPNQMCLIDFNIKLDIINLPEATISQNSDQQPAAMTPMNRSNINSPPRTTTDHTH